MTRYYFHITGDRPFIDVDGLELPDLEAARTEALGVVRDMKRMKPFRREWSGCSIRVTDDDQALVLEVNFVSDA